MLWNLHAWRHSEPKWMWLTAISSRWMYSEPEAGLGELQRLLSTKMIFFLSDFFFIPSTLSKMYSSSTKAVKEDLRIHFTVCSSTESSTNQQIFAIVDKSNERKKKKNRKSLMKVVWISELSQRISGNKLS